ncbi:unnamed protein product, partial [Medioppia subpectinata]
MIPLFATLAKLWRRRETETEGLVFRLHYTLTVIVLMAFCIVISSKQAIGGPIDCEVATNAMDVNMINTFCYVRFTTNVYGGPQYANRPNLGPHGDHPPGDGEHHYYQWVWLVLLLQSVCFYFPHYLWKRFESNRISSIVSSDMQYFVDDPNKRHQKIAQVVHFLRSTIGRNDGLAIEYYGCEFLAFCVVCGQILFNHHFLDKGFITFGMDQVKWWIADPSILQDPMEMLFPLLSKCRFDKFGSSGGRVELDALCVLSLNILNQKMFLFIWFWFYFLAIITGFTLIYRLILMTCPLIRYYALGSDIQSITDCQNRYKRFVCGLPLGDWFILLLLKDNTEPIIFDQIIEQLHQSCEVGGDFATNSYDIENNDNSIQCSSKM